MKIQTIDFIVPSYMETYCAYEDSEGAEEARERLEAECMAAMANDRLNPIYFSDEEILAQEEEQAMWDALDQALTAEIEEEIFAAVDALEQAETDNSVIVDLASFPAKRDVSRAKSQGGVCLTSINARRQGRSHINKARSSRQADQRLEFLYREERALSQEEHEDQEFLQWFDDYGFELAEILADGDPKVQLGSCVINPDVYLDLWEELRGI